MDQKQFGVTLELPISFTYLKYRFLVTAEQWPRLTLLMQSLGSVLLGLEALLRFPPDVFFGAYRH